MRATPETMAAICEILLAGKKLWKLGMPIFDMGDLGEVDDLGWDDVDHLIMPFDQFVVRTRYEGCSLSFVVSRAADGFVVVVPTRDGAVGVGLDELPRARGASPRTRYFAFPGTEDATVRWYMDADRMGTGRSMIVSLVLFVLHAINTKVVVEETTDNRKPSRRGQPPNRIEIDRHLVHRRYVVIDRKEAKRRWRGAPGNGTKKCPHLRRAHARTLPDGRIVRVRSCKIHAEEFAWGDGAREYRVVHLEAV